MKLPNYNKSKGWEKLREQMGTTEIVDVKTAKYEKITEEDLEKLQTTGIEVESLEDLVVNDNTFELPGTGKKVTVYIKEQRTGRFGWYRGGTSSTTSTYKYHIVNCQTLVGMKNAGRFDIRYVQTRKTDGIFPVILNGAEKDLPMEVCKNCLTYMQKEYPQDSIFRYSWGNPPVFTLAAYFLKYDKTHTSLTKRLPTNTSENYIPDDYTRDWNTLSLNFRQEANWICSECNESFKNHKHLLHVHHIDGRRSNNRSDNLKVLCRNCHAHQPGHEHMGRINLPTSEPEKDTKPIDLESIRAKNKERKQKFDIKNIIESGEGNQVEFKASIAAHVQKTDQVAESMVHNILKTIVAFMNTDGGVIVIGIHDKGEILGLTEIGNTFDSYDKMDVWFGQKFNHYLESHLSACCRWGKETYENKKLMLIKVDALKNAPALIRASKTSIETEMYIRQGAAKKKLNGTEMIDYCSIRFLKWLQTKVD